MCFRARVDCSASRLFFYFMVGFIVSLLDKVEGLFSQAIDVYGEVESAKANSAPAANYENNSTVDTAPLAWHERGYSAPMVGGAVALAVLVFLIARKSG